ncbi:MAG: Stk1 family PASTA domain-containing Ser/Thr kinase [Oscillospiraceae bacterium]|nr:Stk1 family PASTA domain-containing Ser/Thr kinase [Oscillospiraceae bacterium]
MDRYIGTLLDGRYEIQEVIGNGGMAVVYKALCHRLNRPVAVKILKDDLSRDEEFRRRFHAESQAVAMMSHPNIVSVYDVSESEGADYIVMELIDGISLKQYMEQKGVLNWRETLHFATQICKALEHAHGRGIIHRDIKPHNIMILKDGSVKVADFGIAHIGASQTTLTSEALGSVHYISPEQARGGKMDFRADLYSLGVVMYEMLTGRPPFDGETPVSIAIQHFNATATPPRALNPSVPEGLEQITLRAMEPDLAKRYPSASQMLQDMEAFRQNPMMIFGESKEVTPVAQPKKKKKPAPKKAPAPKKKRSKTPSLVMGISIVLLAVGALVFMFVTLMQETFRQQEDAIVPDLYLYSAEDVMERYKDYFEFEIIRQTPQGNVAEGLIMNQKPKADMTVKKGSTITLTVSTGVQDITMPLLENHSLADARRALEKFNVKVREVLENSDSFVTNYIIRTEPPYGTLLTPGQEVVLVVSTGSEMWHLSTPKLTGMSITDALATMDAKKLTQGDITYRESVDAKDTVIEQSIPEGEIIRPGTKIDLVVSLGTAAKAQMPVIHELSESTELQKDDLYVLNVEASVSDGGLLSYEWFVSATDSMADLRSVGISQSILANTEIAGVQHYCCKITNTCNGYSVSTYTPMIRVEVKQISVESTKELEVPIPAEGEEYAEVIVTIDGEEYDLPIMVLREEGTASITVTSSGVREIEVYVDGAVVLTLTVDFSL